LKRKRKAYSVKKIRVTGYLVLALAFWGGVDSSSTYGQRPKRPFTVAEDIGLTLFNVQGGGSPELHFSPDGKFFAVWTERGRLDLNQVEDSLRFYRTQDIEDYLKSGGEQPPKPAWVVTLSGKQNPVIDKWRWAGDSSGVAFLQSKREGADAGQQLVLADLRKKKIEPLMPSAEDVRVFDVRDREHFVYVVANHSRGERTLEAESRTGSFVATGKDIGSLLFPDLPIVSRWSGPSTKELWAVVDGKRFEVKHNGTPPDFEERSISLSSDGKSVGTLAPVDDVPPSWTKLYLPPPFLAYGGGSYKPQHAIQAGHGTAKQYVRIDLKSGAAQAFVDAPSMGSVGIITGEGPPAWSSDGQTVLLPGTFLKAQESEQARPCVALVNLRTNSSACVVTPKEGYTQNTDPVDNYHEPVDPIVDARFGANDSRQVLVTFDTEDGTPGRTTSYEQGDDGAWRATGETIGAVEDGPDGLAIKIKESYKEPPLLVAARKEVSKVVWNPNSQLENTELAEVSIYKWKDAEGREWEGGLYKPVGYQPGRRYPLVIQTHGFAESQFLPSGLMSTAFAAQELAGAGILVLQTAYGNRNCPISTPSEAPCSVGLIAAAANQLVGEGLADPERIGIIGFSRTCYYVMEALTTNPIPFKAASITDGVMGDYFQYLLSPNGEYEEVIGAKPFGEGLEKWLKRSPGFRLDKVGTPLLVNAASRGGALEMWLPYSGLRSLQKPVDLIVLNSSEHVLTNPAARAASQGGSVDWFRFWLQGYEDPDPAKAEQYKRWRGLHELQAANEKERGAHETAAH